MTTAEKRAALEAADEPWPDCPCHGVPFLWHRNLALTAGGKFKCRVKVNAWKRAHRSDRKAQGLCVHCAAPAITELLCGVCAEYHADIESAPKVKARRRQADARLRQKRRAEQGFRPSGAGRAAFAAWMKGPG
jgi:hypothetical protein